MELYTCPFSTATVEYERIPRALCTILICPGGAYQWLSPREMWPVAYAFQKKGYNVAVLQYTVGKQLGTLPMREASWAIAAIKEQNPGQSVVLMGFSAGGHLAASVAVHAERMQLVAPDALVLCYPVISVGKIGHVQSMENLGEAPKPDFFSLEKWVHAKVVPTFLWHTAEDMEVPVQNSLVFAEALAEANVPFALHVYPHGVHGLSLATKEVEEIEKARFADAQVASWFTLCLQWLGNLIEGEGNEIVE